MVSFLGGFILYYYGCSLWYPIYQSIIKNLTVEDVIKEVGQEAEARIKPHFERAKVPYPHVQIILLAFKNEKKLELWAEKDGIPTFIHSYPIFAASGTTGPKLREGDGQVPEGIYQIIALNPNSNFYLSIKLNYPNRFDIEKAQKDNRKNLGGDIFIHGKAISIGCIAIGDIAIEELFVLIAKIGISNVKVVIAPNDIRKAEPIINTNFAPPWLSELYELLRNELKKYNFKDVEQEWKI